MILNKIIYLATLIISFIVIPIKEDAEPVKEDCFSENLCCYYDDDSGVGNNDSLTTYFSNEVTYLIVFCQYNPSTPFINLNEGDDCTITFGLNT